MIPQLGFLLGLPIQGAKSVLCFAVWQEIESAPLPAYLPLLPTPSMREVCSFSVCVSCQSVAAEECLAPLFSFERGLQEAFLKLFFLELHFEGREVHNTGTVLGEKPGTRRKLGPWFSSALLLACEIRSLYCFPVVNSELPNDH